MSGRTLHEASDRLWVAGEVHAHALAAAAGVVVTMVTAVQLALGVALFEMKILGPGSHRHLLQRKAAFSRDDVVTAYSLVK